MTNSIFSIAEEKKSSLLRRIGKDMINGGEGLVALESGLLLPRQMQALLCPALLDRVVAWCRYPGA